MRPTSTGKITRNREFKSCTACRQRKLKCDRSTPCSACIRRDDAASCTYDSNVNRGPRSRRERNAQAESRLQHLEELVKDLSQTVKSQTRSSSTLSHTTPSSDANTEQANGVYHGSTHWSAMLDDIDELRATLEEPDTPHMDAGTPQDEIQVLFGASDLMSLDEILQIYLPPDQEMDDLVSLYFRSKALTAPFIHTGQFERQYQGFKDDQKSASSLWAAMLLTVLDITSRTLTSNSSTSPGRAFGVAAARCLAYGRYWQPQEYAVESLLLFAQARCITSLDFSPSFAPLFGALIRLATSMGYHRDPSTLPRRFSPFQAEMRRRTWSLCMQLDVLVSFQLGLPPTVAGWNTEPPANLLDSDFDEDSRMLPLPRPDSEPSEQLFYITKHRLFVVFEKIVRHTLATDQLNVSDLERLDDELLQVYQSLPIPHVSHSVTGIGSESPHVTVTRLCVRFVYLNSVCVLHRKYVTSQRLESIQACWQAASDIIHELCSLYPLFQTGQPLETERWFIGSMTWHHFLLATTALCLVACTINDQDATLHALSLDDVQGTLQASLKLCLEQAARSRDTRRAIKAIQATLGKVHDTAVNHKDGPSQPQLEITGTIRIDLPQVQGGEASLWDPNMFPTYEDPIWASLEPFLGEDYLGIDINDADPAGLDGTYHEV